MILLDYTQALLDNPGKLAHHNIFNLHLQSPSLIYKVIFTGSEDY